MKVNIALNSKSLNEAIKQLRAIKNKTPKMVEKYLQRCCEWVRNRANYYLENSGMGANIIADILSQWTIINNGNQFILRNGLGKGYSVEFGIGIVGENEPHPMANNAGYQYNMPSDYKREDGSWSFYANKEDLDIPQSQITGGYSTKGTVRSKYTTKGGETSAYLDTRDRLLVYTKGTKGQMFLYNSAMDFKSTGAYKTLWEQTKKEYIK